MNKYQILGLIILVGTVIGIAIHAYWSTYIEPFPIKTIIFKFNSSNERRIFAIKQDIQQSKGGSLYDPAFLVNGSDIQMQFKLGSNITYVLFNVSNESEVLYWQLTPMNSRSIDVTLRYQITLILERNFHVSGNEVVEVED